MRRPLLLVLLTTLLVLAPSGCSPGPRAPVPPTAPTAPFAPPDRNSGARPAPVAVRVTWQLAGHPVHTMTGTVSPGGRSWTLAGGGVEVRAGHGRAWLRSAGTQGWVEVPEAAFAVPGLGDAVAAAAQSRRRPLVATVPTTDGPVTLTVEVLRSAGAEDG